MKKQCVLMLVMIMLLCGCGREQAEEATESGSVSEREETSLTVDDKEPANMEAASEEKIVGEIVTEFKEETVKTVEYYDFLIKTERMHVIKIVEREGEAEYYLQKDASDNWEDRCKIHVVKGVDFITDVHKAAEYFQQYGPCDEISLYSGIEEKDSAVKDIMVGRNEEESYFLIRYEDESYFVRSDFENLEWKLVSTYRIEKYLSDHIVYEVYEGYGPDNKDMRIGVDTDNEKLKIFFDIGENRDGKAYRARFKGLKGKEVYENTFDIYDGGELLQSLTWESDKCWRPEIFDYNQDGYLDTALHISDGKEDTGEYDPLLIYLWNPNAEQFEEVIAEETIRYGYNRAGKEAIQNWYRTCNSDAYFYRKYRWEGNRLIKTAEGYYALKDKDASPTEEENVVRKIVTAYDREALQAGLADGKGAGVNYETVQALAETLMIERPELVPETSVTFGSVISRMDGRVISFETGHTFDAVTGEELEIAELIAEEEAFWDTVTYYWIKLLDWEMSKTVSRNGSRSFDDQEPGALFEGIKEGKDYGEIIESVFENPENWIWCMEGSGIRFTIKENILIEDSMNCLVPYSHLASGMKPAYLPGDGPMLGRMGYDCKNELEKGVVFSLDTVNVQQNGYAWDPCLVVNDEEYDLAGEGSCFYSYVLKHSSGRTFLFVCMDMASDDYKTMVFDVTGGSILLCKVYESAYFSVNPGTGEMVKIHSLMGVLGYRYGALDSVLSPEGEWEYTSDVFRISDTLTVTGLELPVWIDGVQVLLPVGTKIQVSGVKDNIVYFTVTQTGVCGEIHMERDPEKFWKRPQIDGREEWEYFQDDEYGGQLIYAG